MTYFIQSGCHLFNVLFIRDLLHFSLGALYDFFTVERKDFLQFLNGSKSFLFLKKAK